MKKEDFVKAYQERMAGELLLAVRQMISFIKEEHRHEFFQAATLGHWVIDVTKKARQHGSELYDLVRPPIEETVPHKTGVNETLTHPKFQGKL